MLVTFHAFYVFNYTYQSNIGMEHRASRSRKSLGNGISNHIPVFFMNDNNEAFHYGLIDTIVSIVQVPTI
jgi:hypothetical protein